jgi:hypothetical protein
MEKNKIPIWENVKDFSCDLQSLAEDLLAFSDKDYQLRVWYRAEGPEVDWYDEALLSFDTTIDWFKSAVRTGELKLSKAQVKAILRLHIMLSHFERTGPWNDCPVGGAEEQLFIIEQPYWDKIRKQAKYAFSLLKK